MADAVVSNPNDYKVVSFHNSTDFGFTPDLGCMYDGRPINGVKGSPGIDAGEIIVLPYHVANRLAINLAKRVLNTSPAATVDATGIPTGVAVWSEAKLEELKTSYLKDLYAEAKPVAQSQTDLLMAKVEEYKTMVDKLLEKSDAPKVDIVPTEPVNTDSTVVFQDKQEVIAELNKRNIKFDARKNKADLEKLLA